MKRSKRLYILLGILAVACIATFAVINYEEKKEAIKNSEEIVLSIETESVQAIAWETENISLAFTKEETWLYDSDKDFPVDEEKMNELLSMFNEFGVSFIIEDVDNYAQYGLDKPTCTINITANDTQYEILLGAYSTMDSLRYISIGDGNVYLVNTDPLEYFDIELSDMVCNDKAPSFESVSQLQFTGEESYTVYYEEESQNTYCATDVYFTQNMPLSTDNVESYLNTISNLSLNDYATYNVTDAQLKEYGLDSPEMSVEISYTYLDESNKEIDDVFVLHISQSPEQKAKMAENEDDDTQSEEEIIAYARVANSQIVYNLSSSEYSALIKYKYNDLRHFEVFTGSFEEVTQIDIVLENTNYTILSELNANKEQAFYYNNTEIEFESLQSAITALSAQSFTNESPDDKQELQLTIHLDNENFEQVKINIYRYDGEYCLVSINNTPTCLVPRSSVVEVVESINTIVLNKAATQTETESEAATEAETSQN